MAAPPLEGLRSTLTLEFCRKNVDLQMPLRTTRDISGAPTDESPAAFVTAQLSPWLLLLFIDRLGSAFESGPLLGLR